LNTLDRPLKVWLIDSTLPGHTQQVDAIGRLLRRELGAECHWIRAKLQLRGGLRSVAKSLVDRVPTRLASLLARAMYGSVKVPRDKPDLIVSSNTPTVSFCRLFARQHGASTIFLGELHWPRSQWFNLVVVPVPMEMPNAMLAPVLQTGQTPATAKAAAETFWPEGLPANCWTMIIGGDGKSHTYRPDEWKALAESMNRLAKRYGFKWLISTSRRTGANNEAILKEKLDQALIQEAIWWSDQPRKGLAAFIHAGERVFATRDSLTMISEVIAIKGNVDVICPADFRLSSNTPYERYLQRLQDQGLLVQHPIGDCDKASRRNGSTAIEGLQRPFEKELIERVKTLCPRVFSIDSDISRKPQA
jgi:mitochondrial fission protein ELM1